MRYLWRRIALYSIAAWTVISLNFLIPRLMPGDPASALFARFKGKLKPEAMAALKQSLGLTNDPLWTQYFDYLGMLSRGEFVHRLPSNAGIRRHEHGLYLDHRTQRYCRCH